MAVKKDAEQKKFSKVMKEASEDKFHSGSKKGPLVKNPQQAKAIAYSEAEKVSKGKKYGR